MVSELLQDIAPHFVPLISKHGFRIVEVHRDRERFDDGLVVAESSYFRLRFTRDRGQIFVEIAAPGTVNWIDLPDVLRTVDPGSDYHGDYSREHVGVLAHGVARHHAKLCEWIAEFDPIHVRSPR